MIAVLCLIACFGGVCFGVIIGLLVQRRYYDNWFKNHCYYCCNKFNDEEDVDKTASFETDLTKCQRAHLLCWERSMFSEHDYDAEAEC
jgi:hypothetical protein